MTLPLTNMGLLGWATLQLFTTFSPTCGNRVKAGLSGGGAEVTQLSGPTGTGMNGLWEQETRWAGALVTNLLTFMIATVQL